eukprot:scaffold93227_cov63-Phaeocystis_antarctica.AAC.2
MPRRAASGLDRFLTTVRSSVYVWVCGLTDDDAPLDRQSRTDTRTDVMSRKTMPRGSGPRDRCGQVHHSSRIRRGPTTALPLVSSCTFSRRQRCRRRSLTSRSSGTKTGRSLRGHRLRTACTGWLRRTASRNTPSLSRTSSPLDCFRTRQRRHCTRPCSSPHPASSDTVATPAAVATTAVATATVARGWAAAATATAGRGLAAVAM